MMQANLNQWLAQMRGKIDAGYISEALQDLENNSTQGKTDAEYWLLRGAALGKLTRTEESLSCFERALQLNPHHETALFNIAEALRFLGEHAQALVVLRRGVALFSKNIYWLHRLWWAERQVCDWQGREAGLTQQIISHIDDAEALNWELDPFSTLLLGLPEQHQQAVAAQRAKREAATVRFVNRQGEPPIVDRLRLRIGWLSADFHDHATMYLVLDVLEKLNHQQFEQVFYSFGPDFEDTSRKRLRTIGTFVDITILGAVEAAQRIANDGIDVLVDLKGYTAFARAAILALRPAPVQVQWLGYPGSMAAPWVDWIIADAHVLPNAQPATSPAGYTERVVYMPHSYQPNEALRLLPQSMTRAQVGLPEQAVVLANFNNPYKIDAQTWDIWMQILQAVPNTVIWLLADNDLTQHNLTFATQKAGVNPQRIIFAPKWSRFAHLQRLALADIALDPLGMGGHTTTSDALRVGLPVVTVVGNTFGRRVAASLLHAVGLPECIYATPNAMRDGVIALAKDRIALQQLRMRADLARFTGELFHPDNFAKNLGLALREMWKHKREGAVHRLLDLRVAPESVPVSKLNDALQQIQIALNANEIDQAEQLACTLLKAYPTSANACAMLALTRYRQNCYDESASLFAAALARTREPNAQIEHNMASALESGGHYALAEAAYRRALALEPQRADTLGQFGCLLRNIGRVDEALVLHQQALSLQPNDAQMTYIYGGSLYQAGQIELAMQTLRHALKLNPELHEARSNLGICHLLRGEFELGWDAFEYRWQSPQMKGAWAPFSAPAWQGEDLNDKAFLGWAEQGLGDNIQFVRYFGLLRQRYPQVRLAFWGPRSIFRLIEQFAQVHQVQLVAREDAPNPIQIQGMDFHAPIMGLPRLMGTRLETIPAIPAYLQLDPTWIATWRTRLDALDAQLPAKAQRPLNVGLVWSGQLEGVMVEKRNIHIAKLATWLDIPNIRWFSLQIGAEQTAQVQGTRWEERLIDWTAHINDFADTASFARVLDLVISVDTSTVHAAAATGTTVWMLSRFDGCWRWLQGRTDTPWYPTITIWRQERPLDWEPVIAAVKTALEQRVAQTNLVKSQHQPVDVPTAQANNHLINVKEVQRLCEQGRALRRQGQVAQAIALYEQAMQIAPERAEPWMLKGFALRMQNDFKNAESCYRQALIRSPHDVQSHFNLAIILLMQRRYAEGWLEYAWRWKMPNNVYPTVQGKRWQSEPLAGKQLLVFQEQGFGDTIQFMRYLSELLLQPKHAGVQLILAVGRPLLRLLSTSCSYTLIPIEQISTVTTDFHVSFLDLPRLLKIHDESVKYAKCLQVNKTLVAHWKLWLTIHSTTLARKRIGLVWSGNANRLRNDHRSIPASALTNLREIDVSIQWVSLQVELPTSDQATVSDWEHLLQPMQSLSDFADTAALIMNLDLVITVDTSVAHLAAALGKPTWVLVCFDSDWRWQFNRTNSPWYPNITLYRQKTVGDWTEVLQQVIASLKTSLA